MGDSIKSKLGQPQQYIICICSAFFIAGLCYLFSSYIDYHSVALLLLMTVSLAAMFFDIWPVLVTAFISALLWDFFFIPPHFTFTVGSSEDLLMLLMYFVIALINAVLTHQIRRAEKKSMKKVSKENTLKLYKTLLHSLSHELRTPIATIIGATDNLQSVNQKLTNENRMEMVSEISKASLRLNRQVENLLNISRLESGVIQPKKDWCDINELVYDVVDRLKENTREHPVSVLIQEKLPLFKIDFGLIEQVLYNLIYNAAIYIPKYCLITVRAMCSKENHLVLMVEDNGEGFPAEEIPHVFDKFYHLNNKAGGTGLGLSIVKGFVEAHDGIVILENLPEGGARFTIEIPAETSYLNNLKNE